MKFCSEIKKLKIKMLVKWSLSGFVVVLIGLLYFSTILQMVNIWNTDSNFSHGFLIPFITIFLVFRNIKRCIIIKNDFSNKGLIFFIIGLLLFIVGYRGNVLFITANSFVLVLLGVLIYLNGWERGKHFLFPINYLFFMVPFPNIIIDRMTFPLKLIGASNAGRILNAIGIPIIQVGTSLHGHNFSLEVADPCSGIRSIFALMAMGALVGYLTQRSNIKKIILFVATVPIALLSNTIRLVFSGFIAFVYGVKLTTGFLHDILGMFVFVLAFVLIIIFGRVLDEGL